MKRSRKSNRLSRRDFFSGTLGTGAALSLGSLLPARTAGNLGPQTGDEGAIVLHVPSPAGPPPLGAPVETSVPFARGRLHRPENLAVYSSEGKAVIAQFRPALNWPDGSIRWLAVAFEAAAGPGDYVLREGQTPQASALVREDGERIILDSGEITLTIAKSGGSWLEMLSAPDSAGKPQPIVTGASAGDLVLTRHDGKVFRVSLDGHTRRVVVEERGPVRAQVRIEGKCRAHDNDALFDSIIRCTAFRGRSEILLEVTWINTTDNPSEQVKDIRVVFPFEFEPERLVIGCATGVYDGPFLKDWPVYVLQEDHNWYWAKTHNPDGRIQNLSSGGCNGEHSPGWLYVQNQQRCLGVCVPNFWEGYPNEIALKQGELSVGLWPERGIDHLLSKPLLPANPQGERAYSMTKYWPILPHPYWAFVDAKKKCLDARQGMAKTQEIVLSAWGGRGTPTFEKKWWSKTLAPVRAHLDPGYVSGTAALGALSPRGKGYPQFDEMLDECYGWLNRHIDFLRCYGKFDYGDFKYFTPSTTYMCHPGTKWGDKGEMPREGYWQNNEGDQLLGLLLYYFRTGDPAAWERCKIVARHLLDLDIRHHPYWGMYTHSYGHCYVATADAGEPDHSWLLGLLAWAGVSGDPVAWDWLIRCGNYLAGLKPEIIQSDARTTSVHLHMMCEFHKYTGEQRFLRATEVPVQTLLKHQNPNGSWPAYLGNPGMPKIPGFTDHAMMALADYYAMTDDRQCLGSLERAFAYVTGPDGLAESMDVSPLTLYALAVLSEKGTDPRYGEAALSALEKIRTTQDRSPDPYGRGDTWAEWGVNNPEGAKGTGRPPQFLGQTRPVTVGFILSYGQPCLAMIAKRGRGTTR
ncbi:MAG: hypothetical protein LAO07_06320 [Acidobacteriia bacterium]|nr:hypothetical protein [Terriglobia bacterium]